MLFILIHCKLARFILRYKSKKKHFFLLCRQVQLRMINNSLYQSVPHLISDSLLKYKVSLWSVSSLKQEGFNQTANSNLLP